MTELAAQQGELAAASAPTGASPSAAPPRIRTLDTVRGVAVMGILAMNIVGFAMPEAAYLNPDAYGTNGPADLYSWVFSFIFIDGRMRGLFSFLFGASMLLVIEGAQASGRSPAKVHYARMTVLLVFGLIHLWFIWWGDILSLYAPVGMIAFLFRKCRPRTLILWGVPFILLTVIFMGANAFGVGYIEQAVANHSATEQMTRQWGEIQNSFGIPSAEFIAQKLALYRGPYSGIVADSLAHNLMSPISGLIAFGPETLGYFLLGMAGYKSGFLTGTWSNKAYGRVMLVGFGIGWPILAVFAWAQLASGLRPGAVFLYGIALTGLVRPIVIPAMAALVIVLSRGYGPIAQRISAAGRAAFTNYLGTSILMTALFYGWGLGMYGYLSRIQLWIPVVAVWVIMLLWSKPWLDRFAYGPLEWLWRSLSRGTLQSMKKR